jgi:hypothetical protein
MPVAGHQSGQGGIGLGQAAPAAEQAQLRGGIELIRQHGEQIVPRLKVAGLQGAQPGLGIKPRLPS